MNKRILAVILVGLFLIFMVPLNVGQGVDQGNVTIGVKKGDWIEYRTVITGTPFPGHDVSRARIDITDVQGNNVTVKFTSWLTNGTVQTLTSILNPAEGSIGAWFLIPANLGVGDTFYDKNAPGNGTIAIQSVADWTYAGASRRVSYSPSYFECFKRWDHATGIFVEGLGIYENYTINTIADKTNMWGPQVFVDQNMFYALIGTLVAVIVVLAIAIVAFRKK